MKSWSATLPNRCRERNTDTSELPAPFKVLFRTGGSHEIGLGHLLRCVALAEAFEARGADCRFAGDIPEFLRERLPGGDPLSVPGGLADWGNRPFAAAAEASDVLVTDLYDIGADWHERSPVPVVAISDPPLPELACDMLVLPATFRAPDGVAALTGPRHTLIRSGIRTRRAAPKTGTRLLVSGGGGNDSGLTARILRALDGESDLRRLPVTVVTGLLAEAAKTEIRALTATMPGVTVKSRVTDMAALTAGHDIAIGTPAGAALERCCLGLAQILIPIAENQLALAEDLASAGAALCLPTGASEADIASALRLLLEDPDRRAAMAQAGFGLIDGNGAIRAADAVLRRFRGSL